MIDVLVRADAGGTMGTGHLMRVRALAEGLRERGAAVHLLTATADPGLLEPFERLGVAVHRLRAAHPDSADAHRLGELAATVRPAWIVTDGYHLDANYLAAARDTGGRVLAIDDMAQLDAYPVDAVLNQNAHAGLLSYPAAPDPPRLLLGTRYVLLRHEFRAEAPPPRDATEVRTLLVTLGGADPHRLSELVVEVLAGLRTVAIRATIVVGAANPRLATIRRAARALGPTLRIVHGARHMRRLMDDADLAISTAGTTVWELAYMGVPSLLIEAGPAERLLLDGLERIGLFEVVGRAGELDAGQVAAALEARVADREWRVRMAELGPRTVDGKGLDRVLDATVWAA